MNKKQRWVLFISAGVIGLMLLIPPFYHHGQADSNAGYGFLFGGASEDRATVNIGTLLVQWVGVMLIGGILWYAFRDKK